MSIAQQNFPDLIASTLMKRGGVGIGPLLPEDSSLMFAWMNDIETTALDQPYRPTDGTHLSSWLTSFSSDPTKVLFAIRVAGDPNAVGFILLSSISVANRSAELGMRIGRERDRNRGIGKAAVALVLDFAWDHLNLARVQLRVLADNARAIACYRAAGFAVEGRHANASFVSGRWHDALTMAALNPDHAFPAADR
ncbi:MAG TPA: GNAT family protein [Rhizomicrobium sp.]|nr:GNAT family protein [Rhizomicrobium sp.]